MCAATASMVGRRTSAESVGLATASMVGRSTSAESVEPAPASMVDISNTAKSVGPAPASMVDISTSAESVGPAPASMVGRSNTAKSVGPRDHSPQLIERQQWHSLVVVVVLVVPLLVLLLLIVMVQKGRPLVVSSTFVQREDHRPRHPGHGRAVCALFSTTSPLLQFVRRVVRCGCFKRREAGDTTGMRARGRGQQQGAVARRALANPGKPAPAAPPRYRPPACPRAAAEFSVKKVMFAASVGILWWCRMNDELTLA
jgi:hypothetical protein